MTYADSWVAPRRKSPGADPALAPRPCTSLAAHVLSVSGGQSDLRRSCATPPGGQMQASGGQLDPRISASLDRARDIPVQRPLRRRRRRRRAAVDDREWPHRRLDEGRSSASHERRRRCSPAPSITRRSIPIGTCRVTWFSKLIAPRCPRAGHVGYLKSHGYEDLDGPGDDGQAIAPDKVDWKRGRERPSDGQGAAAARPCQFDGPDEVRLRQRGTSLSARHAEQGIVRAGRPRSEQRLHPARGRRSARPLAARQRSAARSRASPSSRCCCPPRCRSTSLISRRAPTAGS